MDNEGKGKLIAFGWYGGKYSHLNWLLPLLPKTTHFCEPFGGSAAVLKTPRQEILWVNYHIEEISACRSEESQEKPEQMMLQESFM